MRSPAGFVHPVAIVHLWPPIQADDQIYVVVLQESNVFIGEQRAIGGQGEMAFARGFPADAIADRRYGRYIQ